MTDLKAIQARSLEMAEYFVAFYKEHDLLCYLCGGGAIGALRNKGVIPWDDDLDFFMPRKDYEKLAELWPRYAECKKSKPECWINSLQTLIFLSYLISFPFERALV